jgi:DNA repair exonuclease SbcCD ATPase subunit
MGLFRKRLDPEELVRLKAELNSLKQRLQQQDSSTTDLAARLGSINAANAHLTEQVSSVGELSDHVAKLAERPDPGAVAERVDALATQVAELDARVTAVSTELANQLRELGNDIDGLASRPPGDGPDPEAVTELRDGQTRLANEQARYQIAFREDLARLAEQLRRART